MMWLLLDLVFGQRVSLESFSKDRWGRTIAEVFTVGGQRVGLALVSQGMDWHFVKYALGDSALAAAEKAARAGKRGLWAEAAPVPPWEWRAKG